MNKFDTTYIWGLDNLGLPNYIIYRMCVVFVNNFKFIKGGNYALGR